jgi:hypothetical protein
MTTPLLVWRTLLTSARNASVHDTRIKVSLAVLLVLNLAISIWASNQLALRLQHWQTEGPAAVQTGLWQICLFTSCTTLLVLGSVWDEDLNLAVEGAVQTLLQEEAPLTPRRMILLSMAIVYLFIMFLVLWRIPGMLALFTLGTLTVAIVVSMWNFSCAHMRLLLRKG